MSSASGRRVAASRLVSCTASVSPQSTCPIFAAVFGVSGSGGRSSGRLSAVWCRRISVVMGRCTACGRSVVLSSPESGRGLRSRKGRKTAIGTATSTICVLGCGVGHCGVGRTSICPLLVTTGNSGRP